MLYKTVWDMDEYENAARRVDKAVAMACLKTAQNIDELHEPGKLSPEFMEEKSAQAYQVIGALIRAQKSGKQISDDACAKALDYFADTSRFEESFLP